MSIVTQEHILNKCSIFHRYFKKSNTTAKEKEVLSRYFVSKEEFSQIAAKMNISELDVYDLYINAMRKMTSFKDFLTFIHSI